MVQIPENVGFEVREARTRVEGVAICASWDPHLIWMNIRMPIRDDYETTRQITKTPKGQSRVIIAPTASAFKEDRIKALVSGCDDFVRKPFRAADVFEKLVKHLRLTYVYNVVNTPKIAYIFSDGEWPVEELGKLPDTLLFGLREVVIVGDIELIAELIDTIVIPTKVGRFALIFGQRI